MRLKDLLEEEKNLLNELNLITKEIQKIIKKYTRLYNHKSYLSKDEVVRKEEFEEIDKRKKARELSRQEEKENPSKIKRYNKWQDKDSDEWHYNDIIGYWLTCYVGHFEIEDTVFISKKNVYISKIKSLIKNQKIDPKELIDWFFDSLDDDLSWINSVTIGTLTSNSVLSSYLGKNKNKLKKTKSFQSQEYWRD